MKRGRNIRLITLYEVERRYGGPEEGGWWYDVYIPIRVIRRITLRGNPQHRRRMIRRAVDYASKMISTPRFPVDSVCYEGDQGVALSERVFGQHYDGLRRHYE